MRIVAYTGVALLLAILLSAQENRQNPKKHGSADDIRMFATNRCFSKGGLGIVNADLYIAVKSAKNELLFGGKETWSGLEASSAEVVVFFGGKVWAPQSLPKGFDLSKAVVVSFEGQKIRFFNFQTMTGGYYERTRD